MKKIWIYLLGRETKPITYAENAASWITQIAINTNKIYAKITNLSQPATPDNKCQQLPTNE